MVYTAPSPKYSEVCVWYINPPPLICALTSLAVAPPMLTDGGRWGLLQGLGTIARVTSAPTPSLEGENQIVEILRVDGVR